MLFRSGSDVDRHLDPGHGASKGTQVIALTNLKYAIALTKLKHAHLDRSHGASKGTQHSIFRQTELRAVPEGGAQKIQPDPKDSGSTTRSRWQD